MIKDIIMHEKGRGRAYFRASVLRVAKIDTRRNRCYHSSMPAKNGRNVALTDEQDALVERLLKSGRYASASEVIRDGLRLLQRDEESRLLDKWLIEGLTPEEEASIPAGVLEHARETIRAKVREGLDEARRGEFVDGEKFFAHWKDRLEAMAGVRRGLDAMKRGEMRPIEAALGGLPRK